MSEQIVSNKKCYKCLKEFPLTPAYWYRNKNSKDGFVPWCIDCIKLRNRDLAKTRKGPPYNCRICGVGGLQSLTCPACLKEKARISSLISNHTLRAKKTGSGGTFTYNEWLDLCDKYGNKCLVCGTADKLTPDHVTPIFLGGTNNLDNIQPLCLSCNIKKKIDKTDYRSNSNVSPSKKGAPRGNNYAEKISKGISLNLYVPADIVQIIDEFIISKNMEINIENRRQEFRKIITTFENQIKERILEMTLKPS